jgi:hypothetical protein
VVVAAATEAFSLLFSWYNQPFFAAGYVIPLSTRVFDLRGVTFAAWTLVTSKLNLPGSAWIVSQWYAKGGTFAFPARDSQIVSVLSQLCPGSPDVSSAQCLTQHGYTQWTSYQPADWFWPFQWIEGGWLLALSVLLIAATVWSAAGPPESR